MGPGTSVGASGTLRGTPGSQGGWTGSGSSGQRHVGFSGSRSGENFVFSGFPLPLESVFLWELAAPVRAEPGKNECSSWGKKSFLDREYSG